MADEKYSLEVGDSFTLIDQNGKHLHFIIAESGPSETSELMMVYLTSSTVFIDTTTIIDVGEHDFVDRRSWVKYRNVIICSRVEVEKTIVRHFGKVPDHLFERICAGIEYSKVVPRKTKELFRTWKSDRLFRQF